MEKSDCKKESTNEFDAQHEHPTERFNLNRISDGRPTIRITPGRQRSEEAVAPVVRASMSRVGFSTTV